VLLLVSCSTLFPLCLELRTIYFMQKTWIVIMDLIFAYVVVRYDMV
jgi:hypothetical protein